jgi:hypothetical protein
MASKSKTTIKLETELCVRQRHSAERKYFLEMSDLKRFLKHVNTSIFNTDECILWQGSMTKSNKNKSHYVNFYLRKRKLALHRILYINFVGDLDRNSYLKYSCENHGRCCNINHIHKANSTDDEEEEVTTPDDDDEEEENEIITEDTEEKSSGITITKIENKNNDKGRIIIIFDD